MEEAHQITGGPITAPQQIPTMYFQQLVARSGGLVGDQVVRMLGKTAHVNHVETREQIIL
jgi:hypothetical protein